MTAPGSPWMTMYLVGPRKRPVGARNPGSSKSFMMLVVSSGLNCHASPRSRAHHKNRSSAAIDRSPAQSKKQTRKEGTNHSPAGRRRSEPRRCRRGR
uniref:Uncharacterized protein n=1 Tax=Arundo donax TaxID=35708 RepID=A0A0A9DIB5_ARUDO